jgi:hypothetical protein
MERSAILILLLNLFSIFSMSYQLQKRLKITNTLSSAQRLERLSPPSQRPRVLAAGKQQDARATSKQAERIEDLYTWRDTLLCVLQAPTCFHSPGKHINLFWPILKKAPDENTQYILKFFIVVYIELLS